MDGAGFSARYDHESHKLLSLVRIYDIVNNGDSEIIRARNTVAERLPCLASIPCVQ